MSTLKHAVRAKSLRTGMIIAVVVAFIAPLAAIGPAWAAASGNLDQCTNGKVSPLTLERCAGSSVGAVAGFKNWVNGNSNGSKSHWREGEFISYRTKISGIAAGTHTLILHYDTVHGGKHALDYVGDFDATETTSTTPSTFHANNSNPCLDLVNAGQMTASQCVPGTPTAVRAVPAATLANCSGSAGTPPAQIPGSFKLFGPAGTTFTAATYTPGGQNVPSGSGQCSTTMSVSFNVPVAVSTSQALVIAWGGHIASQGDWGVGNSASAISGSPYHMALDLLDGASTGAQDRALSTSAIFFTPSIATVLSAGTINVGGTAFDTSTLSGASQNAGGTVTYTVYTDSACTLGARSAGTKNVTNGIVPNSDTLTFNTAGTFYWQASYSGDSINQPAKSACTSEILTVGRASPSISTTLSATSVAIGTPVHDSSTLTGASATAGGTVTYTVYSNNTCTASPVDAGTKTVTNGVVPDSNNVSFNSAGTFYWQAVYSGDVNNGGAASACTSEIVTVNPNTPSIATTLSATSGSIGDSVHDSATLTGATANAGGTVTYTVYSDNACTLNSRDAGTKTVTNGNVPDSDNLSFNSAGTFYWQASYSGDGNNASALSPCTSEILVIGRNSPSIATTLSAFTAAINAPVHDSAALTGATTNAGGNVTYTVYSNDTCTTSVADGGTKTVTNGSVPDSDNVSFGSAGTFYWQAVYSGDSNNNAATSLCTSEILIVTPNSPTIATTLSAESASIGSAVHDSATLSGATSNAGGTVTYTVYSNNTCTATPVDAGTKTVTNGSVPDSDPVTFNSAGTFYWQASYSGDANNNPALSPCTSEVLVIGRNNPRGSTAQNLLPNDSGTITGATANAGGTITFKLFDPDDANCAGTPAFEQTVNVSGNGTYDTTNTTFLATAQGTWNWLVTYSGDGNNNGFSIACGVEHFSIANS
jgi:hypothetical protein